MTLKVRSRSPKCDLLFPSIQQCIYASLAEIHPLVPYITHGNHISDILKCRYDLENWSRPPKSNQLVPLSQQCIYASLVKIHQLVQKITHGKVAMWTQTLTPTGSAIKTTCLGDIIKIRTNILAVLLLFQTASMVASRQQKSSEKTKT